MNDEKEFEYDEGDAGTVHISSDVELFVDNAVIDLYDEDDNCVQFFEVAGIEHEGKYYEMLQPVEPNEHIAEDEVVFMECDFNAETGETDFKPVIDEALLTEIFGKYTTAYEKYSVEVLGEPINECDCSSCGENCNHGECDEKHQHAHDCEKHDCGGKGKGKGKGCKNK